MKEEQDLRQLCRRFSPQAKLKRHARFEHIRLTHSLLHIWVRSFYFHSNEQDYRTSVILNGVVAAICFENFYEEKVFNQIAFIQFYRGKGKMCSNVFFPKPFNSMMPIDSSFFNENDTSSSALKYFVEQ